MRRESAPPRSQCVWCVCPAQGGRRLGGKSYSQMGGEDHQVRTRPHLRTPGWWQVNGWFRAIEGCSCCAHVSERHQGCPCGHAGYCAVVQGRLDAFLSSCECLGPVFHSGRCVSLDAVKVV
jgi:hypothetical protein